MAGSPVDLRRSAAQLCVKRLLTARAITKVRAVELHRMVDEMNGERLGFLLRSLPKLTRAAVNAHEPMAVITAGRVAGWQIERWAAPDPKAWFPEGHPWPPPRTQNRKNGKWSSQSQA